MIIFTHARTHARTTHARTHSVGQRGLEKGTSEEGREQRPKEMSNEWNKGGASQGGGAREQGREGNFKAEEEYTGLLGLAHKTTHSAALALATLVGTDYK